MRFLENLDSSLVGHFLELLTEAVTIESAIAAQNNRIVVVPGPQGSGKTALAFLSSSLRYVMFASASSVDGAFGVVRSILEFLKGGYICIIVVVIFFF
jgi:replication-associated recombination protein RarA